MLLRVVAVLLFGIWLFLVLLGKGGFVHLLLLSALGVTFVEIVTIYRGKMRISP